MNNHNPIISEISEMYFYLKKFKHILIFRKNESQLMVEKFLNSVGIKVKAFIVDSDKDFANEKNIYTLEQVIKKYEKKEFFSNKKYIQKNVCIIVLNEDRDYVFNTLKDCGFKNIYYISEWNSRTIPFKMRPRPKEIFGVEVNLTDHCNLNCHCCDHLSPIANEYFLDIEEYKKDLQRLADISNKDIGMLKIEGGEPTIHPLLIDFLKIAREIFPKSSIVLFTNGILLPSLENSPNGNLWQAIKDYNICLAVTTYPIKMDYKLIDNLAKRYEIIYSRFVEAADSDKTSCDYLKKSVCHPFKLNKKIPKYQYISCYQFNESITLRHGKIYTCPLIPYSEFFNKYFNKNLKIDKSCYIDIYKAKSFEEITEFCSKRTDFCSYCDIKNRYCLKWAVSRKHIREWS